MIATTNAWDALLGLGLMGFCGFFLWLLMRSKW